MTVRTTRTTCLLAGLLAAALAAPVAAQTAPTPAPTPGATGPAPGTLAAVGYGETSLRGTYGSAELFVPVPPGRQASGDAVVELAFDHSPLLRPRSTLTVLAGGVAVGSARLTPENTTGGRLTARVPASLVGPNGLALSLRGYLRLTDDDCEESDNPAQWVTVRPASTVVLATSERPRSLQDVQALLTGGPARPVEVQLPGPRDPQVLQAAGVVAAQVGRWQGEGQRDALVLPDAAAPAVVVATGGGSPDDLPLRWTGTAYTAAGGRTVEGGSGVLALTPTGPVRVLVGGATPAAVGQAATALASPATAGSLTGTVAALTGRRAAPVDRRALPWRSGAATLAQLGFGRQDAVGTGLREVALRIDRPGGWDLRPGGRLDLDVEASAALRARTSTLQVLLNGNDLGTRGLRPGAGPATYRFELPEGVLDRRLDGRPLRALDLTVRFLLDVPQEQCQPVQVEAARATVLPTTAFRLPHEDAGTRELGRFPHPLDAEGPVTVVLPEGPSDDELAAGLQTAAAVGRWSDPGAPAPVLTTADRLTAAQRAGGVVLLGDADADLDAEVDLGRSTAEPGPGQASALLGLVPSPFAEDATALVVQGDGDGLLLAARTLGSRAGLATLRGDNAAVVGPLTATALSAAAGERPPVELAPVLGGPWYEDARPWAVPALVLLGGLLALLAVVARYRWGRRRRARRAATA